MGLLPPNPTLALIWLQTGGGTPVGLEPPVVILGMVLGNSLCMDLCIISMCVLFFYQV